MAGYTKIPNSILDILPEMKPAEQKIVLAILRETVGWQRERVGLSLSQLEKLARLSRPSVNTGIQAAINRGILHREPEGESFVYWITEPTQPAEVVKNFNYPTEEEPVKNFNYPTEEEPVKNFTPPSKKSLPEPVKNFNQEVVKNLNHNQINIDLKKGKKEREKEPPTLPSPVPASSVVRVRSPYLDPRHFVEGRIPMGAGVNPVEVYYERYSIHNNEERLSEPLEEDLARGCPDLPLLREVLEAYQQSPYRKRNIRLIIDWYKNPTKFRRDAHNGPPSQNAPGNAQANYRRPETTQYTMEQHKAHHAAHRGELPF